MTNKIKYLNASPSGKATAGAVSDHIRRSQIWTASKNTWTIIKSISEEYLETFSQVFQQIVPAGRKDQCEGQPQR